jgi:hypothetical protein
MIEENNKTEYITRKDLEEQTQVLLNAMDSILNKRLGVVDSVLDKRFTEINDKLDGVKTDVNNVQTLIDGYVKAQESFRQEFEIMKVKFEQMKKIIKEKLGLDVRAI